MILILETIEDSLECATMVLENDVPIGRMEFVDPLSIDVINKHSGNTNRSCHHSTPKHFGIDLIRKLK